MSAIYSLYALKIGDTVIDQITSQSIAPGLTEMLISGDGSLDNEHVSVSAQDPTITFRTTAIQEVLDALSVSGLVIAEEGSSNGIEAWFLKRAKGGGFEAGAEHLRLLIDSAVMVPMTATATHPEAAEIECTLHVIWDGSANNPIQIDKDQALPNFSPSITDVFTIGPWWVNGTKLVGMRDFAVDFGLQVEVQSSDGEVWPRSAHIMSRGASMTGTTLDMAILDDTVGLGIIGEVQSGGEFGIRAFLKKKEQGAAVHADASTEHIRFSIAEGRISPSDGSATHPSEGTVGLLVTPTSDGVHNPVAYATDVAVA